MKITRKAGFAPQVATVSKTLAQIGGCIGCDGCRGLCPALIEMLAVPDAVLRGQGA